MGKPFPTVFFLPNNFLYLPVDLLGKSLFCCSDFGNTFALTISH